MPLIFGKSHFGTRAWEVPPRACQGQGPELLGRKGPCKGSSAFTGSSTIPVRGSCKASCESSLTFRFQGSCKGGFATRVSVRMWAGWLPRSTKLDGPYLL